MVSLALLISAGISYMVYSSSEEGTVRESAFTKSEKTNLSKYNLSEDNQTYLKSIEINETFYEESNLLSVLGNDDFILFLFSDFCNYNCLNNDVITELRNLEDEEQKVISIDINKISDIDFVINFGSLNQELANVIFLNSGIVLNSMVITEKTKASHIIEFKNKILTDILDFENSSDKVEFLKKEFKEKYTNLDEEEISKMVEFYLENEQ